ncbi:MAG: Tim44-like domain-containing protein, partial [Planctomycetales bacterium]
GGGGGGGGGGDLIFMLIYLCIRYPVIGIPVLLVVGVGFVLTTIYGKEKGTSAYQHNVINRAGVQQRRLTQQHCAEQIRQSDPSFSEDRFVGRVTEAFLKTQEAWSSQKLEPMRHFVSDGVFERFSLQIQEQRDLGYRNVMENVRVTSAELVDFKPEQPLEAISVKITASAVDYRVSLADGKELPKSRNFDHFVEYWTFLRKAGAKSVEGDGLMEGNCPNCGSGLELNRAAKCESCGSLIRGGEYDWVLAEITQAVEWNASRQQVVPGADSYRERDESFSCRQLEDRASVIFYRKAMAERVGAVAPIAKMASEEYCQQLVPTFSPDAQGTRKYWGDCAVGAVDTVGLLPGDGSDLALVEVRWSAYLFDAKRGQPPRKTDHNRAFRSLLVLTRNSGVKTDATQAMASNNGPSCGAPEEKLTSHACEFCGEVLNRGTHDWVLHQFLPLIDDEARRLVQQARAIEEQKIRAIEEQKAKAAAGANNDAGANNTAGANLPNNNGPGQMSLILWAIKQALADDDHIDQGEREVIAHFAQQRGVSPQHVDRLITAAGQDDLDLPVPIDKAQENRWLRDMADAILWDGKVTRDEFKMLKQAGAPLGYDHRDLKSLLKIRQKVVYQQAREQLKNPKSNGNGF